MKCQFCGKDDPNHTCSEALYGEPAECPHDDIDDSLFCPSCGRQFEPTDFADEDGGKDR